MKHLSIIKYVFSAISVVLVMLLMVNSENDLYTDLLLYWAYFLLGITTCAAILFPTVNIIKNPKAAMSSLVGLGIVVVVIGVSYLLSSGEPIVTPVNVFDNVTELKLSDTGLYTTYVAMTAAILSIVGTEIAKVFK